jgi:hypothetical protein
MTLSVLKICVTTAWVGDRLVKIAVRVQLLQATPHVLSRAGRLVDLVMQQLTNRYSERLLRATIARKQLMLYSTASKPMKAVPIPALKESLAIRRTLNFVVTLITRIVPGISSAARQTHLFR